MESSEFYSELRAKGLQLANHDGETTCMAKRETNQGRQGAT